MELFLLIDQILKNKKAAAQEYAAGYIKQKLLNTFRCTCVQSKNCINRAERDQAGDERQYAQQTPPAFEINTQCTDHQCQYHPDNLIGSSNITFHDDQFYGSKFGKNRKRFNDEHQIKI